MQYLDQKLTQQLKKNYHQKEIDRKAIIEASNKILHSSKRVIFSLHRQEKQEAQKNLQLIEKNFKFLEKKFNFDRLIKEGSFNAAAEEYTEAKMFFKILNNQKITEIKEVKLPLDSYVGGLCDLVGELVRLATNQAALGKREEVVKTKIIINEIMEELIQFDFTGYLRNKYDQAKNGLRKIEQIDYEVNLKSN